MRFGTTLLIASLIMALAPAALATVIHVNPYGSGDYPTIQAALAAAGTGDVIELADGVYTGSGNRDLEVTSQVTIQSAGGYEDCVIDCEGSAASPRRAFIFTEETGGAIVGVTVRGGWETVGGVVLTESGSYSFTDCLFLENHAAERGGVWHGQYGSVVTFEGCIFSHNTAGVQGGALSGSSDVELELTGCTLVRNGAPEGGSLFLDMDASADIAGCIIAWGTEGSAYGEYYAIGADFACCNLFGNRGGDWVNGAGGLGVNGNISADPKLADPMATPPNVGLTTGSPCRAATTGCGTMGAGPELDVETVIYGVAADGSGLVATIQEAFALVDGPAEVWLDDGIYTGAGNRDLDNLGRSLTLASRSGVESDCLLAAGGQAGDPHRHLDLSGAGSVVELVGLTLEGGYAADQGGSLHAPFGVSVILRNCMVRDNVSAGDGGALWSTGPALTLEDCWLETNSAGGDGGAMATNACLLDFYEVIFDSNAAGRGAALYAAAPADGSQIGTTEILNSAGGGCFIQGLEGVLTFESCQFNDNENDEAGGAVTFRDSDDAGEPRFVGCGFYGNSSGGDGGAISSVKQIALIECSFDANTAAGDGGALSHGGAFEAVLTGVAFHNNHAVGRGGAASLFCSNTLATDLYCEGNTAGSDGGAVYLYGFWSYMQNCEFRGNHADGTAGALQSKAESEFVDCIVWDNSAGEDTAALLLNTGAILTGCTVVANEVLDPSAAIGQIGHWHEPGQYGIIGAVLTRCIVAFGEGCAAVGGANGYLDTLPVADCCALWGNTGGPGTVDHTPEQLIDPLLCDLEAGELGLRPSSPCLPEVSPCDELIGALGVECEDPVAVEDEETAWSTRLLRAQVPNPFHRATEVVFALPAREVVHLEILDVRGAVIRTLAAAAYGPGVHRVAWDGRDDAGRPAGAGAYLCRLRAAGTTETAKMLLVR